MRSSWREKVYKPRGDVPPEQLCCVMGGSHAGSFPVQFGLRLAADSQARDTRPVTAGTKSSKCRRVVVPRRHRGVEHSVSKEDSAPGS